MQGKTISYAIGQVVLLLLFASLTLASQTEKKMIDYTIAWQQANSHLFEIVIQVDTNGAEKLDFALPNWRPGRYLIQNYARNVQEFSVSNEKGEPLDWEKANKSTWQVKTNKSSRVKVFYKYFANILDAGASLLDDKEAYFNGTNLFMYLVNRRDQACRLTILAPENWQVATALKKDGNSFLAQNYDELADSPTIASPTLLLHQFIIGNTTYHLAFQGKLDYDIEVISQQLGKIIAAQVKLFGGNAPFEHYWFLYHILPNTFWHGVEHSFSTSITMPANAFATDISRQTFYSISAHELFHAWNVKRIMPNVFLNPDYSQEAYTKLLWFFEGVTSYYGDLSLKRAGVIDERTYLAAIERNINQLQNTPGRLITSVEDASFNDWLQPDDRENSRISFYNKGEILGLLLDLQIRKQTANEKSLDDVMQYLYKNYALLKKGVPENGIQKAIEAVTEKSFDKFFDNYISGCEELPYSEILETVGLTLLSESDKTKPTVALGIRLGTEEQATILNVTSGSPAMLGGLSKGDTLLAINNTQVNSSGLSEILMNYQPGDKITVTIFRNRQLYNFPITLTGEGNITYKLKNLDNKTDVQKQVFNQWVSNLK
ncbi:MAG: M61 family metallopeptidase [Acidobacteria bacterium]|nr:M61 family metallopeptidase [Acidobacteriota bacterium]